MVGGCPNSCLKRRYKEAPPVYIYIYIYIYIDGWMDGWIDR